MKPGDVISYLDMCRHESVSLQRGMNFRLRDDVSVILMSGRPGAPYADRVEENGKVLIYEGHDIPRTRNGPDPKTVNQPYFTPGGAPTQNGLFFEAALKFKMREAAPELVRVYEKIRQGIWVFGGFFRLIDAWQESVGGRKVFKFKLELLDSRADGADGAQLSAPGHDRLIPTSVRLAVWKRDRGQCAICGSRESLHFDHIIPYSKGGSSLVPENVQILCAKHNLQKKDRIE